MYARSTSAAFALLGLAIELTEHDDGNLQLLRQRFDARGNIGDLDLPAPSLPAGSSAADWRLGLVALSLPAMFASVEREAKNRDPR